MHRHRLRNSGLNRFTRVFSTAKETRHMPFVGRAHLTELIRCAVDRRSTTWVLGGLGSGKTSEILRFFEKTLKVKNQTHVCLVFDFDDQTGAMGSDFKKTSRFLSECCASQLASQVKHQTLLSVFKSVVEDFPSVLSRHCHKIADLKHISSRSRNVDDLWSRLIPNQNAALNVLSSIRLSDDADRELDLWISVLRALKYQVVIGLLHIENFNRGQMHELPMWRFTKSGEQFSVLIESNDALTTLWNIGDQAEDTRSVIQVPDLPLEAVRAVFVPSLLSDEAHVNILYEICGGRVGLLERLVPCLNRLIEERQLKVQEQEFRYRSGKEIRPSSESRDLQVDPLIFSREVALRESVVTGVFAKETTQFNESIDELLMSFGPLRSLQASMSPLEFKVMFCETIRFIVDDLSKRSFVTVPADKSPLEIAHPVVLGLLYRNILTVNWIPIPRLEVECPIKLFLLRSWYSSFLDSMSLSERVRYNLILSKNKVHLRRQLDKLVA
jgi:hypothetical protein